MLVFHKISYDSFNWVKDFRWQAKNKETEKLVLFTRFQIHNGKYIKIVLSF